MAHRVRQPQCIAMDATTPETFGITIHPDRVSAFRHNASQRMEATRYFIDDDIWTLGFHEEVVHLLGNIGWESFFVSSWETYRGPTLEYLTTLKLDYHGQEGPQSISFNAGGGQYDLSTLTINREM